MQATRTVLAAALAVAVLWSPARAAAESADKVIARYTKAQGQKALRRVTSTTVAGSVDGASGRFDRQLTGPDRFRQQLDVAGSALGEAYNGKSAWRRDAGGVRTLVDLDARQARLQALLANTRFQELSRFRITARALGTALVEGRSTSVVEFALEGARERVFFDAASGLPARHQRTIEGRVEETYYGDYRRVDGVLEPFSIRIASEGRESRVVVERVEHNRPVDERAFQVPAATAGAPLPDLATLLTSIRENQAKVVELQELYAFRETRIERRNDGKGGLTANETRVFRVLPAAGRLVRELVSVDGKELSAADREKERRRAQKEIAEAIEERDKRRAKAERAATAGKANKEEEDDLTIATFLRVSEISSVRRETFRGRPLLAFDFEPRDDYKATNLAENVAGKLAGTIWVDEAALQVVRLEARLTKKVKIGGGFLASLAPDSLVVLEQAKVNDEVWLPSFSEIVISGRALLFAKINQNTTQRFSDYERYAVDGDGSVVAPPDPQQNRER